MGGGTRPGGRFFHFPLASGGPLCYNGYPYGCAAASRPRPGERRHPRLMAAPRPKKRRTRRRRPLGRLCRLALLVLLAALFLRWENTSLQVTSFAPAFSGLPAGFDGCRLVVLSDLHGAEFGPGNEDLFDAVAEAQPDYIFCLGDLEDRYRGQSPGYAEAVAEGLSAIAPLYYVTGNHEWAIGGVRSLKARLEAHGAHVLSNAFLTLERNGDTVVLAGVDDPNGFADQKTPEQVAAEIYAAHGDPFWLLLAHRNSLFREQYSRLGADLVLSGHGHGGIIRLPFTDGLLSTERTFFPTHTAGLYEDNGTALFVTRGLGNSGPSRRLFNRPEVAVVTLRRGSA